MTFYNNTFLYWEKLQLRLQFAFKNHHLFKKAPVWVDVSHGLDLSNRCHKIHPAVLHLR